MLQRIFVVVLAAIVLATVSEFFDLIPEQFGDVGRMNDFLGVIAILILLVSFGASAWPSAANRVFRRPLKRAYREIAKQRQRKNGQSATVHYDFYAHLTEQICTTDDQIDTSPARLIASARGKEHAATEWPWDLSELATWAHASEERLRSNIMLRFLMSDRLSAIADRLSTLRVYALGFPVEPPAAPELAAAGSEAAKEEPTQHSRRRSTRALVTAIEGHTGVSVLATGLQTRAGVHSVRLWHSDGVRSLSAQAAAEHALPDYAALHLTTGDPESIANGEQLSTCEWEPKLRGSDFYLLGDRDNHVPVVDGVTVSENRWAGTVEFVLSTHSSCTAAADHSPFACKGPSGALDRGTDSLWIEEGRVVRRNPVKAGKLESALAVHAAVVITDENDERYLVLVRRGNTFRYGNNMLTVPGETLALAAGGRSGKVDAHGAPDLLQHVISGVHTALGRELKAQDFKPSHVIMVNQRESVKSGTEGRSQLVSTVGFTASIAASQQDMKTAWANAARVTQHGVRKLEFLPLGKAGETEPAQAAAAIETLLDALAEKQRDMDQMSTTAALIVAARLLGIAEVTKALEARKDRESWWQSPWLDEEDGLPRCEVPLAQARVVQLEKDPHGN